MIIRINHINSELFIIILRFSFRLTERPHTPKMNTRAVRKGILVNRGIYLMGTMVMEYCSDLITRGFPHRQIKLAAHLAPSEQAMQ